MDPFLDSEQSSEELDISESLNASDKSIILYSKNLENIKDNWNLLNKIMNLIKFVKAICKYVKLR